MAVRTRSRGKLECLLDCGNHRTQDDCEEECRGMAPLMEDLVEEGMTSCELE